MKKPPENGVDSLKYNKIISLKDGRKCCLRNGTENDAQEFLDVFNLTHAETDYLLSYPDENSFTVEQESAFLKAKTESSNEIEIIAVVDGKIAGTAGIDALGNKYKTKHRAEFGIGIAKEFWGLGIGRALTEACIECAKEAGYTQLELDVVSDNASAISLYKKVGFVEYGRNSKGFNSRISGYQELVYMKLDL
ncbi:MAG TPA: GNAT family N-acetyltransferase [Ruminococcaceae bacterium]|nr:GNAT family N-acetyltransferase [Oscillospiraceae bacterium]HBW72185.1 GNAT family N-acetyltransferase [Oscillospiraceae bacterium]